jgi:type IV pilus assembly protein PilE
MTAISPRHQVGFTLIELMITVAIVGVLAAVAYPAYTDQVRKGRRADARAAVMSLLQQQERYMTQRNTYKDFTFAAPDPAFKHFVGESATNYTHQLGARQCRLLSNGVQPALADCIEVFATPRTTAADPQVTEMAIDTLGRRNCLGSDTSRCWK